MTRYQKGFILGFECPYRSNAKASVVYEGKANDRKIQ